MNISGTQNRKYPYGSESRVSENRKLYRFMDIDLTDFLGKIAEKVVRPNTKDWEYDKEKLVKAAMSDDPDDRRLIWLVSATGTRLSTERETFIEDTPASRYMTEYRQYPPDFFGYIIEVRGMENGIIKGNAFDIGDISEYAWYVRRTAVPLESVTLTYSDEWGDFAGQSIDVPHYEFAKSR